MKNANGTQMVKSMSFDARRPSRVHKKSPWRANRNEGSRDFARSGPFAAPVAERRRRWAIAPAERVPRGAAHKAASSPPGDARRWHATGRYFHAAAIKTPGGPHAAGALLFQSSADRSSDRSPRARVWRLRASVRFHRGGAGFEPATNSLTGCCSTSELTWHPFGRRYNPCAERNVPNAITARAQRRRPG